METKTKPSATEQELGDETFMSADDLRSYMTEMQMARAAKEVEGFQSLAVPRRGHSVWT